MWWWVLLSVACWSITCSIDGAPSGTSERPDPWMCPEIAEQPIVECTCDMPHTLRCTGDKSAMHIIGVKLRSLNVDVSGFVSLLDCTVQNVSTLPGLLLEGVSLHGLVVSSGEIREINSTAFRGLAAPLQALGLPNNKLTQVPTKALKSLPELDRLDLSGNKMKSLDADSFKGLFNLSFIELSDNILTRIDPNAFDDLSQLKILRLRGNHLTIQIISKLNVLPIIEELDISENSLLGPLGPKTFPKMEGLKDLQLAHNSLSSIKMAALEGLPNITSLSLHHNLIDVLEDNAFSNLGTLVRLDLAHNRIVAVSGASLAHLIALVELDLRHNFLRALTADLVIPLKSLRNLRLDDNDISIVSSDALRNTTILERLTLSGNPLNCDCSLIEFAVWLANSSSLNLQDKSSVICTTPPILENGLLINVTTGDLLCTQQQSDEQVAPIKARINLETFNYDGRNVFLKWQVDESAVPFTCDAIFVYEEEDANEVLVESNPLRCNSTEMQLTVSVPNASDLIAGHRYRYCVVLLESEQDTEDLSLVLGCSDVIALVQNTSPRSEFAIGAGVKHEPRVIAIQANLTNAGDLTISVLVYPRSAAGCEVNVVLLEQAALISQKRVNCSDNALTHLHNLHEGPYRVCANIAPPYNDNTIANAEDVSLKPRCVTVFKHNPHRFSNLDVAFVSIFLILSFMVVGLIYGVRRVLLRPKLQTHHHHCFMPPELEPDDDDLDRLDEQQHNRYVKLQATTKL